MVNNILSLIPYVFTIQALIFAFLLFYFVVYVTRGSKVNILRAKIFLRADPIIKSFYLFLITISFTYTLFLIYFFDTRNYQLFLIGELSLGFSLIGFAFLIITLIQKKSK